MEVPKDQAQQSNEPQKAKTSGVRNLRTFAHDIAQLINENKISSRDLAKIDPTILASIKNGEVNDFIIASAPTQARVAGIEMDPLIQEMAKKIGGKAQGPEDKTFDLDAAEKNLGKGLPKGDLTPQDVKTPPKPIAPVAEKKPEPKPIPKPEAPKPVAKASDIKPEPKPIPKPVEAPKPAPKPPVPVVEKKPEPKPVPKPEVPQPMVKAPEIKKELSPAEKIKQEQQKVQDELIGVKAEEKNLAEKEDALKVEKSKVETQSQPLRAQEHDIEQQVSSLRQQEKTVSTTIEKQEIEKKRWNLDEQRQKIEHERWTMDQKIVSLEQQITDIITREAEAKKKELASEHKLDILRKQEVALQAEVDKVQFVKKLDEIKASRATLEHDWKDLMDKKKQAETIEADLAKQEAALMAEIQVVEEKEHAASTPDKVHEFEQSRWDKEKKLRTVEEQVWKSEADIAGIQKLIEDIQKKSQDVLLLEKNTKAKIAELEALIQAAHVS